mgnify:CR=1 FL=1
MSCNNLHILNFNHSVVVQSNGNTIVVTDKVKCNSVTIPQPVTKILQINSPGPQGPPGPSGSGGGGGGTVGGNATASFTNSSTWTFNHNLGSKFVVIQTFDTNYNETIPQNVQLVNTSSATITFPTSESGYAVASLGGLGNTLSASYALTASYALNGGGSGAGFPYTGSAIITGSLIVSGTYNGKSGITGSLLGTSSYATSASRAISASYAPVKPAGPSLSVQFNNNGVLTGSSGLIYSNGLLKVNQTDGPPFVTVDDGSYTSTLASNYISIDNASIKNSVNASLTNVGIPSGQTGATLIVSVNGTGSNGTTGNILLPIVPTASYASTASTFPLPILDEGNQLVPYPTALNFAGDGIYATRTSNNDITVFVPGILGGISAVLSVNQPLTGSKNIYAPNTSSFFIRTDNYPSGTFFISSSLIRLGDWTGSVNNNFIEINDTSNTTKIKSSNISLTGSVYISGSFQTLPIQTTLTAFTSSTTVAGTTTLFTQLTSSYNSAFGKYTIISQSSVRAGEFMAAWNSGSITYTDFSTTEIGSAANVVFSSSFSGNSVRIQTTSAAGWTVKMLTTFI